MHPPQTRTRTRATGAAGNVQSSSTVKVNGETRTTESPPRELTERVDHANPAYVSVGGKLTKNMGDYNSISINVSVSLPCLPTDEAVTECYHRASKLVDGFMDEEYVAAIESVQGSEG